MPLIALEEATETLEYHFEPIYEIVSGAFQDYQENVPDDVQMVFSSRTRASAIHDYMIDRAAKYATDRNGVRVFESKLMYGLTFDNKIALRFKKLNEEGLSKNQPTKQVQEFRGQVPIDGVEAVHHLEAGYILDDIQQSIQQVKLVCPSGEGIYWMIELSAAGVKPVVLDIFENREITDDVQPAIIVPKEKGIIIPFKKKTNES